ncbi:MAG: DUF2460 domain-containing protein [Parvularculaceae bacterium]|nr:DUF2460 domain-containing protein [Parvularculaceae bacterium]
MARQAFHDVLFPLAISLGATGGPSFRTDVVTLGSGHEVRRARWSASRRRWDVRGGIASFDDVEPLLAFFEERQGRRFAFAFRDPFDHSSTHLEQDPHPTDQQLATADGTTTRFELRKACGIGQRAIDLAVVGTVRVALDGTEVAGTEWTLSPDRDAIDFSIPPAAGLEVSAGFLFDVPCRFASDDLALQLGARGAAVPAIELVEVRL